jgi:hypothetical protein
MISIVVTGRNDDYAGGFQDRLFRTCRHNSTRLTEAGLAHEFVLVEWNPVEGRPLLARAFCTAFDNAHAFVVPADVHRRHVSNPHMSFDEMAAKNVGIRRARGEWIVATNADILFGSELIERLRHGDLRGDVLYRAHRIDVPADVSDPEVDGTFTVLASGEGSRPPAYYLGAGGDFGLAGATLWHRLGGFNQRVRFSTRAKDWQFFLSAAALGVDIEFIGRVFHLDHEGGFRNTPPEERDSGRAHFGGAWDVEFGLPLEADPDWGLPDAAIRDAGERIVELCAGETPAFDSQPDHLEDYLAWPAGVPDTFSAALVHAVFSAAEAGRALRVKPSSAKEAVATAGAAAVAESFGLEVSCDWIWPTLEGFSLWLPDRKGASGALTFCPCSDQGAWGLFEPGGARLEGPLPTLRPPLEPRHNPLLGRRLLRAWLRMRDAGVTRLAIYGAGGHTEEVFRWGVPDRFAVEAILVTGEGGGEIDGIPVRSIRDVAPEEFDAVLLSSIPYEAEMEDAARQAGFGTVIPLWGDWPRRFWGLFKTV